jgi:hypothetical protein
MSEWLIDPQPWDECAISLLTAGAASTHLGTGMPFRSTHITPSAPPRLFLLTLFELVLLPPIIRSSTKTRTRFTLFATTKKNRSFVIVCTCFSLLPPVLLTLPFPDPQKLLLRSRHHEGHQLHDSWGSSVPRARQLA